MLGATVLMSVKDDLRNVVLGTVEQRVGVSGTVPNGFAKKKWVKSARDFALSGRVRFSSFQCGMALLMDVPSKRTRSVEPETC